MLCIAWGRGLFRREVGDSSAALPSLLPPWRFHCDDDAASGGGAVALLVLLRYIGSGLVSSGGGTASSKKSKSRLTIESPSDDDKWLLGVRRLLFEPALWSDAFRRVADRGRGSAHAPPPPPRCCRRRMPCCCSLERSEG
jgi:hypothetical protein